MEILVQQLYKMGLSMCVSLCEVMGHITQPGGPHS